jgi:hypothetical protein
MLSVYRTARCRILDVIALEVQTDRVFSAEGLVHVDRGRRALPRVCSRLPNRIEATCRSKHDSLLAEAHYAVREDFVRIVLRGVRLRVLILNSQILWFDQT